MLTSKSTQTKLSINNKSMRESKKEIKEIRMCGCGGALHWTFLFAGAEYYCMNCGFTGGMFGSGEIVELTTERKAINKVSADVFVALRKHLWIDPCFQRTNCKKCKESNEYHPQHATEYEKARREVAWKLLEGLRDSLTPNQ